MDTEVVDAQVPYIKWCGKMHTVSPPHPQSPNHNQKQYRYLLKKIHMKVNPHSSNLFVRGLTVL